MIDFIKRAATNKTEGKTTLNRQSVDRPVGRSIGSMIVTKVNERESKRYRQIEIQKKSVQLNGRLPMVALNECRANGTEYVSNNLDQNGKKSNFS